MRTTKETRINWVKIERGLYQSECTRYEVSKTYSRSGWMASDRTVNPVWYIFTDSLEEGKAILQGRVNSIAANKIEAIILLGE